MRLDKLLDLLIEERLNEKTGYFPRQNLDKDNIKQKLKVARYTRGGPGSTETDDNVPDGLGTPENWLKLAGLDGEQGNFTLEDVNQAYKQGGDFTKLVDYLRTGGALKDRDKKDVKNIKAIVDLDPADIGDFNFGNASDDEIKKVFDKYLAQTDRKQGVGTVDLPYRAATVDKDWKSGDDLKISKALPQSTISVFRKGMLDAGGDVKQYFEQLEKLGDALAFVSGKGDKELQAGNFKDKEAAETYLKGLKPETLFNTATLLKTLGTLAKEVQGASSGTIFETFLALGMGAGIFGGKGGAADIIAGEKGERKFSAKQYAGKPGGEQSSLSIAKEVGVDKKTVWYIGMAKVGKVEKNFNRLDIYICGIKYKGDSDKQEELKNAEKYQVVNSAGKGFTFLDGFEARQGVKWKIRWPQNPDFMIPISPSWGDTDSIASFDKLFVDAVEQVGDEVKKAIKNMNVMLARLNDQTKIYIADKSPDAAQSIGKDYGDLKAAITGGIGKIGDDPEREQFKTRSGLQENENNLDNLLDKMIQEVILTK